MYTQTIIKEFLLLFFTVYKNEWKEHKLWQQKYQKSNFYNKNKKIFNIDDTDVNKILVSKKEQYGKYDSSKYFIGYNANGVIRPLYLFLTTDYINKFDKNKITKSLMIKYIQLLKSYNKIRKKNGKINENRVSH